MAQQPGSLTCGYLPSLQLTSLSDRYVSHFETDGPHVLLYFDSVSRGKFHRRGHWALESM